MDLGRDKSFSQDGGLVEEESLGALAWMRFEARRLAR